MKELMLLLVVPSALDSTGNPVKLRKLLLPSITMPLLAALTPDYVHIKIIYETVESIPYEEQYDLVGITGMGSGSVRAWQIGDEFKKRGVTVVIGGVGPSLFDPEVTLEHADAIVIGEAEDVWPELIEDFRLGKMKKIYVAKNPSDLSVLPSPRYDLMNLSKMGFMRCVQATRGCPYTCTFCSVSAFFKGNYRKRPVEKVIQDVRLVKNTGSKYVLFIDDNLFVDIEYNRELWQALIAEKIIWIGSSTVQIADHPDLIELAYKSGCRLLSIGIESLNTKNLKSLNKDWNHPSKYNDVIEKLRINRIMVSTSHMLGLDSDTSQTFDELFDFIMVNHIPIPRILIFTPIPGTPVYNAYENEGRITNHDYSKYTGGNVVFKPVNMSPETLEYEFWNLCKRLFTPKNIFLRMSRHFIGQNPIITGGLLVTNFNYRKLIWKHIIPGIT